MRRRTRRLLQDESIPDEQEQEEIIADLRDDNLMATKYFKLTIAVLCVVATVPLAIMIEGYILLRNVLAITSLLMTAFILRYLPDRAPTMYSGPLERFAVPLNSILAALVLLLAYLKVEFNQRSLEVLRSINTVPIIMHALATMVRYSAARISNEIEELEKQKYVLKGA